MRGANLDRRLPALGIGSTAADDGIDAKQRPVRRKEIGRSAEPGFGIAVEVIDLSARRQRFELIVGVGLVGTRAGKAVGELRREVNEVGGERFHLLLVQPLGRERRVEHGVPALPEEPLEVGEERLRVLVDGRLRARQLLAGIARKARR